MKVFYNNQYIAGGRDFDTTRKSGWIADSMVSRPIANAQLVSPEALSVKQVSEVHDPRYVRAVKVGHPFHLASSAGHGWDNQYWGMVSASNGGAVAACVEAYKSGKNAGSLSSGLHHASFDRGMGFCTFNGLALGAVAARKAGAQRVLVIDLDAHCGGGTNNLLGMYAWVDSIDISTSSLDSYKADNAQWTMDVMDNSRRYLQTIDFRLAEVEDRDYDLIIYNSGMDPYKDCMIGGMAGIDFATIREREQMVFGWARNRKIPVAFVLAGGYSGARLPEDKLVELHRLTIQEAAQ